MKWLDKFERLICVCLLAAIVLLVFLAAVMRTVGIPVIWSVEVAQLLFVWLAMLAANQTFRHSEHASVDILMRRLTPARQQVLLQIFDVAMIAILLVVAYYGFTLFAINPKRTLGSTDIPYQYVTLALPVGAILMISTLIQRLIAPKHHKPEESGL
ncbi:TRAP transporter small permease [Alteromonas pelagimontana]|uniref:TRAP transporter small permease protein n=1 Tax=Alteromonas pelagimontana TaxID=1858656 RepID=A0A6M4MDS0_9ALTE|nr:TRAP transporter small permease [Alteromonas pelagimontana]QJR81334.1 TRAP transporter small permease [Alteromonas pelagimontana]